MGSRHGVSDAIYWSSIGKVLSHYTTNVRKKLTSQLRPYKPKHQIHCSDISSLSRDLENGTEQPRRQGWAGGWQSWLIFEKKSKWQIVLSHSSRAHLIVKFLRSHSWAQWDAGGDECLADRSVVIALVMARPARDTPHHVWHRKGVTWGGSQTTYWCPQHPKDEK